jgi:hypothetical protein
MKINHQEYSKIYRLNLNPTNNKNGMLKKVLIYCTGLLLMLAGILNTANAQGVTTSAMSGIVTDMASEPLIGASVVAVHTPTGTQYGAITSANGRFNFQNVRVGGPYTVTVSYVGFAQSQESNIVLTLGENLSLVFILTEENVTLSEVTVVGKADNIINAGRTGAATNISNETINAMPTISRSVNDFTRLTPQASGKSFVGQDSRFNNITVDGSIFNNSFGLTDQPGGRTGSTPISLDAIEQVQVNIAPFDVRQAGFTGAGVNAVTRSGTNEFTGSVFYNVRNENFVGRKAKEEQVLTTDFVNKQYGFRLGGPIIKNKLFFFVNGEMETNNSPATPWVANRGQSGANVTRVLASDLDNLSTFLRNKFGYETGPYEGYNSESNSYKFLAKLDYNISKNHKASLRYNVLDSKTDLLVSNSSSLGLGNRRTRVEALNFQNSNYMQLEKIHSIIGEVNSTFGSKLSNNFIAGYTYQNEDRGSRGDFFPLVEILKDGSNYTTFGFEPFTPGNQLSYKTYQLQNNLTYFAGKHVVTAGFNVERMEYKNVFFPGSQSVYVYNSLEDFYQDANGYLENPNRTTSDVTLRRFQLRYSALPGGVEPVQPTKVTYSGIYLQDEYTPMPNLRVTAGVRADVPVFDKTGYYNPKVDTMTFRKPDGSDYKINTAKLPDPKVLISPRIGFNWDVTGEKTTQVRGGTGLFTGRPVFVWISNQIGNNGVLTGFESIDNDSTRPFNPNPAHYIPADPSAGLPKKFSVDATDPNFKFPQVWRSNLAIDQKLPFGVVGTLEAIYSKDINGIGYFNANQKAAETSFNGPDDRPRYQGNADSRINPDITSAIVLTNNNSGYSYSLSGKLEKQFESGFYAMTAYNFGESKNTVDAGSIAYGSWAGINNVRGGNYADLAFSGNDQRHRFISALSYKKSFAKESSTQVSLFFEGRNQGRYSYTYTGDFNNDGVTNNDLIYIPRDKSEMNFETYTTSGRTFTKEEQEEALEKFIAQDKYLSERRGQYAERNGAVMPWVFSADLSIIQEYYFNVGGKKNTLQFRADIINVGNLINNQWGVSRSVVSTQPLRPSRVGADGTPIYRMNTVNVGGKPELISETYRTRATLGDVWQAQFGIRYIFN